MTSSRAYNWTLMRTAPAIVVSRRAELVLGSGVVPDWINWNETPQGAEFWIRGFRTGNLNAARALVRLLQQAQRDFARDSAPVYDIAKLANRPEDILVQADYLRTAVRRELFHCIWWHNTPQGTIWWRDYFRTPVADRDPAPLEGIFTAAKRASRLKGGTK